VCYSLKKKSLLACEKERIGSSLVLPSPSHVSATTPGTGERPGDIQPPLISTRLFIHSIILRGNASQPRRFVLLSRQNSILHELAKNPASP
jgi:hypothetical protein